MYKKKENDCGVWDLSEIRDVNGSWVKYHYINREPTISYTDGYSGITYTNIYTAESHLEYIQTDKGDKITLTLGDKGADEKHLPYDKQPDFDMQETKFLDAMDIYDATGAMVLNHIDFTYSGESGQIAHFNPGISGMAKRYLTAITAQTTPDKNYRFTYDAANGQLKDVISVKTGGKQTYTMGQIALTDELVQSVSLTAINTDWSTNTHAFPIGNHIFNWTFAGTWIEDGASVNHFLLDIASKDQAKWKKTSIVPHARPDGQRYITYYDFYPGYNRFILVSDGVHYPANPQDRQHNERDVLIYEYIDGNWVQSQINTLPCGMNGTVTVSQGPDYFVILEKQKAVIYVYKKIGDIWCSTFNCVGTLRDINQEGSSDYLGFGWNWVNASNYLTPWAQVFASSDYFMFVYQAALCDAGQCYEFYAANIFRWNGSAWIETSVPERSGVWKIPGNTPSKRTYATIDGNNYKYDDIFFVRQPCHVENFKVQLFPNYYLVSQYEDDYSYSGFCLRNWDTENWVWRAQAIDIGELSYSEQSAIRWAYSSAYNKTKYFAAPEYFVVYEPGYRYAQVFRCDHAGYNGSWARSYMSPSGTSGGCLSGPEVTPYGHLNGQSVQYCKQFDYEVDSAICLEDGFGAYGKSGNMWWRYRWNNQTLKWDNIPQSSCSGICSGTDAKCQGTKYNVALKDIYFAPDMTAVLTQASGQTSRQAQFYKYNYAQRSFDLKDNPTVADEGSVRVYFTDQNWIEHLRSYTPDGRQGFNIHSRYLDRWAGKPVVNVISSITSDGGVGSKVIQNFDYSVLNQGFDYGKGTGVFGKVIQKAGNGLIAGATQSVFDLDSNSQLWGVPVMTLASRSYTWEKVGKRFKFAGILTNGDGSAVTTGKMNVQIDNTKSGDYPIGEDGSFSIDYSNQSISLTEQSLIAIIYTPLNSTTSSMVLAIVPYNAGSKTPTLWVFNIDINKQKFEPIIGNSYEWPGVILRMTPASGGLYSFDIGDIFSQHLTADQSVTISKSSYSPIKMNFPSCKEQFMFSRVMKSETRKDGVWMREITPDYGYNGDNGMSSLSYTMNSENNKALVSKTFFAYETKTGMNKNNSNMLTQPAVQKKLAYDYSYSVPFEKKNMVLLHRNPGQVVPYYLNYELPISSSDFSFSNVSSGDDVILRFKFTPFFSISEGMFDGIYFKLNPTDANNAVVPSDLVMLKPLRPETPEYTLKVKMPAYAISSATFFVNSNYLYASHVELAYVTLEAVRNFPVTGTEANSHTIAASFTDWQPYANIWRPSGTYGWNVPLNNGVAQRPFTEYVSGNSDWVRSGTIDRYNTYGQAEQTTDAVGIHSTKILRNDEMLPIGGILPAAFTECGVFTGDYKAGSETGYWDYKNGWEKGQTNTVELISGTNTHFGKKVIHVIRDYAAGRNNRMYPGKAYRMTAWVKVVCGTIQMKTDFRYCALADTINWPTPSLTTDGTKPVLSASPISSTDCNGTWKLMTLEIPASVTSQLSTSVAWYTRSWVGNDPLQPSFEAYVDDVRFYPADALVNSTYYDGKWRQPILTVDANDNPSKKIVYDNIGRPIEWRKIDKTNPASTILVQSKSYHLMGE